MSELTQEERDAAAERRRRIAECDVCDEGGWVQVGPSTVARCLHTGVAS